MEQQQIPATNNAGDDSPYSAMINTFSHITSTTKEEASFFLESHNYDLNSAVSTFFETTTINPPIEQPRRNPNQTDETNSHDSSSPPRSRSASPPPSLGLQQQTAPIGDSATIPYNLRSRNAGNRNTGDKKASGSRTSGPIRTFADLNQSGDDSESDSDEHQEYYTGGAKSGQMVQDPTKVNDIESLYNQVRQAAGAQDASPEQLQPSSSSRSFAGRGRLLSGETTSNAPQPQAEPVAQTHTLTFWANGFTVNDGPLRRLDDPENAAFLESIRISECPEELRPANGGASVNVNLVRKFEDCPVQKQRPAAFSGVGRTLGTTTTTSEDTAATATATTSAPATTAAPTPFVGLVVDDTLPSTSIQLRFADGTRMVSRFNFHHTVNNIRSFIDASRPGGPWAYQLLTMGFPPKQLNDLNQTIEEAGLANSVVIQKL